MKLSSFLLACVLLHPPIAGADQQASAPRPGKPGDHSIRIESVDGGKLVSLTNDATAQRLDQAPSCAPPCSLVVPSGSYRLNVSDGRMWTSSNRPLELVQPLTLVAKVDSQLGLRVLGGALSVAGLAGGIALMVTSTYNKGCVGSAADCAGVAPIHQTNILQLVLGGVAVAAGLGCGLPLLFLKDTVHVQMFMPGAKIP